jgi:hypothetical protein
MQSRQDEITGCSGRNSIAIVIYAFNDDVRCVNVICGRISALCGYLYAFSAAVRIRYSRPKRALDRLPIVTVKVVTPSHDRSKRSIPPSFGGALRETVEAAGVTPKMINRPIIEQIQRGIEV